MGILSLTGVKAIQTEVDITVSINGAGATMTFPANTPVSFGDAASITISQSNVKVALMKNTTGFGNSDILQVFRCDEITTVA